METGGRKKGFWEDLKNFNRLTQALSSPLISALFIGIVGIIQIQNTGKPESETLKAIIVLLPYVKAFAWMWIALYLYLTMRRLSQIEHTYDLFLNQEQSYPLLKKENEDLLKAHKNLMEVYNIQQRHNTQMNAILWGFIKEKFKVGEQGVDYEGCAQWLYHNVTKDFNVLKDVIPDFLWHPMRDYAIEQEVIEKKARSRPTAP